MKVISILILLTLPLFSFSQKKKLMFKLSSDSLVQQEQTFGFGSTTEENSDGFNFYIDVESKKSSVFPVNYVKIMLKSTLSKVKLEDLEIKYSFCQIDGTDCSEEVIKYISKAKARNGRPKLLCKAYVPLEYYRGYFTMDIEDYFISKLK